MQGHNITPHCTSRVLRAASFIFIIFLTASYLLAFAGCGEETTTAATGQEPSVGTLQRPSEGEVLLIDDLGDMATPEGNLISAANWVDINRVSISREGEDLTFEIQVNEQLPPSKPADILAVEWGFLLDVNDDDSPDWGIYCAYPEQEWSCGLYRIETKERLADQAFPGSFTHEGTTLTWTLNPAAFGSEGSFRWVAYVDAARPGGTSAQSLVRAADKAPNNAWPLGGWLSYP